jgi:excisionase family DNA binding protein
MLDIGQVAELLQISKDTVRRRIKSGEIKAVMEEGPYGKQYKIDPTQFAGVSPQTIDVIPVTRQINIGELVQTIKSQVVEEVKQTMQTELQEIKESQNRIENMLKDRDTKLLEEIRQRQENQKPFWKKFFS